MTALLDVSDEVAGAESADARLTALADTESAARVEASSLQEVQRAARIGTWEWDPATDLVALSEVSHELLGVPAGRMLTLEDYVDAVLPEDREVVRASLAPLAEQRDPVPVEYQFRIVRLVVLHYQPIVTADGAVHHAEALARWQHPRFGLLGPGHFLPAARRGGLLPDLDRWVLSTALREVADWPLVGGRPLPVSINLSGLVPGDENFVEAVDEAVTESGLDWNRVVLELVETDLVDLRPHHQAAMELLVERGARFAIDDFGTGYSSLARLRDLPAQIIKIDRRFVTSIAADAADHAVAQAVTTMAHAMGMVCTAEGVETREQLGVLAALGVDHYQGFLFSPAVPEQEFRAVLGTRGEFRPRT
ncbi:EAL domain-containing protein [Saccharopolyspora mangrovi]|uniref:EAL domain-containing protein n=1 Tax=Saccharopolyspora mangrovi TaxID=3082379 RepID=A0ABU6ADE7_9PSEU|nr:EAL domain-containing protein [Saccharopolyspora sp. S2-29]MEB3369565.1 EAL domain-containing protein [Saccharopolyspora sp. S2-29]